ncbi:MAG: diacylglycerol kinase family protein [Brevinematales bacterium]|nr:diacylglycerol kinase family protein [Brevinematales bacterium]
MKRFLMSFVFAFRGIILSFRGHRNIWVQFVIGAAAVALSFWLALPMMEFIIIIIMYLFVIILEMMNTGIEALVDHVSPEYHEEAGKVKDIYAGAVLMGAFLSAIVGVIILGPPLAAKLRALFGIS